MGGLIVLLLFGLYCKLPSPHIGPGSTGPTLKPFQNQRNKMKLGIVIVKKAEFLEFICHSIKVFPEQNFPGVLFQR